MSHRRRLTYQPALDGLRAFAVIVVILFHAGVAGFGGGYIGVSVFFTLSGYLITSLLVAEQRATGTIAIGGFFARRIRRLLPAGLTCIMAIVITSSATDWFVDIGDLRAQVIGSLLQVENWVLLAGEGSYQRLLADGAGQASPLAHFWSLAIEEQFYWVWPGFVALAFWYARRKSRTARGVVNTDVMVNFASVIVFATVASVVAAPVIAVVWGPDAAYWATPARLAEILIGAAASVLLTGRKLGERWDGIGWAGLAVLAGCVVLFPSTGGPAYAGALPLVGLASTAVVLGSQAQGSLQRVLSARPLVAIGKVSYGAYVYHWPIFVVLTVERTGWDPVSVFVARIALTALVTVISFVLIEQPVRLGLRVEAPVTLGGGLVVTGAAVLIAAAVVPVNAPYWQVSTASAAEVAIDTTPEALPTTVPSETVPPGGVVDDALPAESDTSVTRLDRPLRVVTAGDSTAGSLATGLIQWAVEHDGDLQIKDLHFGGCGVMIGGDRYFNEWSPVSPGCDDLIKNKVPAEITKLRPDVVVISVGVWDLMDHRWDGVVYTPFDQTFADHLLFDYTVAVNSALDAGARSVALVINPPTQTNWGGGEVSDDPARQRVLKDVIEVIASNKSDRVRAVDLWSFVDSQNLGDDRDARPDGVHWTADSSTLIADEFLVEELFRTASYLPPEGRADNNRG